MTDKHMSTQFDAELSGKDAQIVLDRAGITVNKNTIPDDPRSPFVTSGLRLGTPSVTTQGMEEGEMATIARLLATALLFWLSRATQFPCAWVSARLAENSRYVLRKVRNCS